jgi:spore maturation protein CgeB
LRTFEIPVVGSLFLAERTLEHKLLFEEDYEAVFFSSPAECASKCHALLCDESRRAAIAKAGQNKIQCMHVSHADVLSQILLDVTGVHSLPPNPIDFHLANTRA